MSLAQAILISLADCPKSGYDLAKAFDGSVGFFWEATHQQIYRELTKLENQGWLSGQNIAQAGRPDKKLYSVTELGYTQLREWVAQPCNLPPNKNELLLKIFSGDLVPQPLILQEVQRHRQLHVDQLAIYQSIEQQYFADPQALSPKAKFQYLTLRCGMRLETEWIAWCDEAIATLAQE